MQATIAPSLPDMTRAIRASLALCLVFGLAGCDGDFRPFAFLDRGDDGSDVPPPPSEAADDPADDAVDAEGDAGEEAAAPAPAAGPIGTTVASLGDPGRPGLWLETPLVTVETPGRVEAENGNAAQVTIYPSGGLPGSGSRISLAAMQALGLGLTDLPTLTVIADG